MRIKTVKAYTEYELDNLVNSFEKEKEVKATQTHIVRSVDGQILFFAVMFYNDKEC